MPINTIVVENDEDLVRQAIVRELDRNGQVYFSIGKYIILHLNLRLTPQQNAGSKRLGLRKSSVTGDKSHPAEAGFSCLYNRVYDIDKISRNLARILPAGIKIAVK